MHSVRLPEEQGYLASGSFLQGSCHAPRPPKLPSTVPQIATIKDHKGSIKGPLGGPGSVLCQHPPLSADTPVFYPPRSEAGDSKNLQSCSLPGSDSTNSYSDQRSKSICWHTPNPKFRIRPKASITNFSEHYSYDCTQPKHLILEHLDL